MKAKLRATKQHLKKQTERMELLKANMVKNQETLAKREQLKAMLERQCALEEKKTIEQDKIASQREQLLELKMKELVLQKTRLERAISDFRARLGTQLEVTAPWQDTTMGRSERKEKAMLPPGQPPSLSIWSSSKYSCWSSLSSPSPNPSTVPHPALEAEKIPPQICSPLQAQLNLDL